jgi:Reverse transcriptase (RNA-dependent DNA polymerase)
VTRSDYVPMGESPRRAKARAWSGVGVARISIAASSGVPGSTTVLRVRVASSVSRVRNEWAGVPYLTSRSHEWLVDADISACFDEIDHQALLGRVRGRIGDRRVLALVAAFLRAGILGEDGIERDTATGTPQGGILSPLLANIALSVLDEHFVAAWAAMGPHSGARQQRRLHGAATYRLVRYADDSVVLVAGTRDHAEALRSEVAAVLAPMGLRLSAAKTKIAHIDGDFDFLGFRVVRQRKRGSGRSCIYTYPAKRSLAEIKAKVRTMTRGATDQSLSILLHRFQPGAPGLDRLLPARRLEGDLQLPARLRLAQGGVLAPPQEPPGQLEAAPPALRSEVVADGGRGDTVQPGCGGGQPLPLPWRTDPLAVGRAGATDGG